jgi:type I restriction enzyme M protein
MQKLASAIVQKVWNYANILKDDGLAFMDYTEQITYLIFLKMAHQRDEGGEKSSIPSRYNWASLLKREGEILSKHYARTLSKLSEEPGLLGLIFTKPQSKINDPAKLSRLIHTIDSEDWASMDVDVKGEIYEGLLARNAEDVRGGAGQYFTPRPVIRAIVEVMRPEPTMRINDPACGSGGFLIAAHAWIRENKASDKVVRPVLHGTDLVPNVARLCAMNLYLHGISGERPIVEIGDSLRILPEPVEMVLTNPPFGKKSSITVIGEDGRRSTDSISYKRPDFWATTSNKQLNFVQHVYSMLKDEGKAAVVIPDNVLFEAGAGETIRRALLKLAEVHTLLRLPTGIFYAQGVSANVLFFDRKPRRAKPWTKEVWIYDLRTNKNFTPRERLITSKDLEDFVRCYSPEDRRRRKETDRFKCIQYDELVRRDKCNLDITWLTSDELQAPNTYSADEIANEIVADLRVALEEFERVSEALQD